MATNVVTANDGRGRSKALEDSLMTQATRVTTIPATALKRPGQVTDDTIRRYYERRRRRILERREREGREP